MLRDARPPALSDRRAVLCLPLVLQAQPSHGERRAPHRVALPDHRHKLEIRRAGRTLLPPSGTEIHSALAGRGGSEGAGARAPAPSKGHAADGCKTGVGVAGRIPLSWAHRLASVRFETSSFL